MQRFAISRPAQARTVRNLRRYSSSKRGASRTTGTQRISLHSVAFSLTHDDTTALDPVIQSSAKSESIIAEQDNATVPIAVVTREPPFLSYGPSRFSKGVSI
jgi:hypothetical protein